MYRKNYFSQELYSPLDGENNAATAGEISGNVATTGKEKYPFLEHLSVLSADMW